MDTSQLQAFVAIAAARGIGGAARALGVSQPALSRRIQALETEIGATLLVRTTTGTALTAAGERFLGHASRALDAIEVGKRSVDEIAGRLRGVVAIGAIPTVGAYVLPDVLARFCKEHVDVSLRLREALPARLEDDLAAGELDLVLLNLPTRRVGLVAQKLWQEDYVLAVPSDHRLAAATTAIALTEIAGERLILIPRVPASAALLAAVEERGKVPRVAVHTDSHESARRLVMRGVGVALLPRMLAHATPRGVRYLEVSTGGVRRQVALVHRGIASLTPAARALRAEIVRALKGR